MFLLMTMLLMACGGSEEENSSIPEDEDCYLDIYVYAPDRPIVTRGDVGEIEIRAKEESEVHTLQIWVFKSSNGDPVGYLNAGGNDEAYDVTGAKISDPSILNEKGQQVYRMKVDKSFANNPEAVDVYVVANAASCGLTTLGKTTSRADLNNAKIGEIDNVDYFGTTDLYGIDDLESGTRKRIYTNGLPMSAVLKNQPISGKFPTLRIGTESQIATLHLTRAVSKLRFVLCRIKEKETTSKKLVSIDGIQLNGNQIPTQTYLMPGTYSYANKYVEEAIVYVNEDNKLLPRDEDIPQVDNPLVYVYDTQNAQDYEDLIDAAVGSKLSWLQQYGTEKNIPELAGLTDSDMPQLKQIGLTYLRESDKQLTGTIRYKYRENGKTEDTDDTADFLMAAPGDFLRNHSWIIYVYYMDSKIYTLTVTTIGMKKWTDDGNSETTTFYNW